MIDPEQLTDIRQRWDGTSTISGAPQSLRMQQAEQDIRYLLKSLTHLRQQQAQQEHELQELRARVEPLTAGVDGQDLPRDNNDPSPPPAPEIDVQQLAWAVSNCHTLARRELNRLQPYVDPDTLAIERWEHVLRICEKAGARSAGVLRASLPTEITDGSQ